VKPLEGGVVVTETRHVDSETRRVHKTVEWTHPVKEPVHWHESVRLYEADELEEVFDRAGLKVRSRFGDFDGRPLGSETPRMIFVAQRRG
jgi:hypothetical protein